MLDIYDDFLVFDCETTGLWCNPMQSRLDAGWAFDRIFSFAFCNAEEESIYFRATVNPETREVSYDNLYDELQWLESVVADPTVTIWAHNAPFDRRQLEAIREWQGLSEFSLPKFDMKCQWRDTKVLSHVVNPSMPSHSLKPLCKILELADDDDEKELHKAVVSARRVAKKKGWRIATTEHHGKRPVYADFFLAPDKINATYNIMDTIRCVRLMYSGFAAIDENTEEGGNLQSIWDTECELSETVKRMTDYGMTVQPDKVRELIDFYDDAQQKHLHLCHQDAGDDFEPGNHHHVRRVLVKEKKLRTERKTDKGNPKCDADQLSLWARGMQGDTDEEDGPDGVPLARNVLEWRACEKTLQYLRSYEHFMMERDDGSMCIRPSWNQTGPITGRISCSDPNLMQIADAEKARRNARMRPRQREAFGPRPGFMWYAWDYSQFEVWLFMFDAGIREVMDQMMYGFDAHSAVTNVAWSNKPDLHERFDYYRQRSKITLFTKLYGGGRKAISESMRITRRAAQDIIDNIEYQMPGIGKYQSDMISEVRKTGVLVNMLGREYPIDLQKAYKAVNYRIQGSQADLLKRGMIRVDRMLMEKWPLVRMFTSIHDELVFEFPKRLHSKALMYDIADCLQADSHLVPGLEVPLPLKCKVIHDGDAWSVGKEYKFAKFKQAA